MIALFLMGLLGISLLLVGGPIVLFVLMLETCRERMGDPEPEPLPETKRAVPDASRGGRSTWPVAAL